MSPGVTQYLRLGMLLLPKHTSDVVQGTKPQFVIVLRDETESVLALVDRKRRKVMLNQCHVRAAAWLRSVCDAVRHVLQWSREQSCTSDPKASGEGG